MLFNILRLVRQNLLYFFIGLKIKTVVILILLLSISSVLFFVTPTPIFGQNQTTITSDDLINLTNQERAVFKMAPLYSNFQLTLAAKNKADDLIKKDYFSHNSPDGKKFSQWVKEVDYQYAIVGENLAMGFSSAEAVLAAWMKSEKHRQNILNPKYNQIGIYVRRGKLEGENTYVIVQYFGAPYPPVMILSENLLFYQKNNNRQNLSSAAV